MPVRIYDLAKKLGVESKLVLAKAKELNIAAAKVPSSSLDKITAEFLEQQVAATLPHTAAAAPPSSTPHAPAPPTPITLITEAPAAPETTEPALEVPEPENVPPAAESIAQPPGGAEMPPASPAPAPAPAPVQHPAPAPVSPLESPVSEPLPATDSPVIAVSPAPPPVTVAPATPAPATEPPKPTLSVPAPLAVPPPVSTPLVVPTPPPPPAPPVPRTPQVGDLVGRIQLTPRVAPRPTPERGRPGQPQGRTEFQRRTDGRDTRGPRPQNQPGQRAPGQQAPAKPAGRPGAPAPKAADRFVAPATGELITLKPPIIVRDLAEQLKRKPFQIIADLMGLDVFANVNQAIDEEVAKRICAKYGFRFEVEKRERGAGTVHAPVKKVELDVEDKPEDMKLRAPVVTIMGHVDHGKTTLLDVIRKSNVAAGEAGGITQHIGAYTISFPHPEKKGQLQQITFLDTPGHAAFSAMRARGANVTDIVVLVVAANDGVMPQTLEALSHAQAAKATIIVAVNKSDHPNANPLKVRQQLQDKGLVPDDWGGETIFVDVSALTRQGVDKLLEMILLQADILELKANPNRRAKGNIIESGLEPGGPTATVLVRKGTLRVGDVVICGQYWGKVRALINEENSRLKEAGPSVAVKILGLNGVPEAGLEFSVLEDEKGARELAEQRAQEARTLSNEGRAKVTLENLFATLDASQAKTLKVVVKADTQGSVEAIVEALKKIESEHVSLEVIHSAVGTITESDITLASASHAVVLGFHTRIDVGVADLAKAEGVQIKLYSIIYELVDQVKEAMAGLLDPIVKEVIIGSAEVRKIFALSKGGNVAGCMVNSGRIVRGKARILRRKGLIYEGAIQTLRRFQDEVNEVRAGMECGIRIEGFGDMQPGDVIECFTTEKVAPKL